MIILTGYKIQEKLYESNRSLIYRGQRNSDDLPIILKVLKQQYPTPEMIDRFKLEYQITRSLNLPGTVQAYSLEKYNHSFVMVLEDFGAISLQQIIQNSDFNFSLQNRLILAIKITEIIAQIHNKSIIHKDINPSNIVVNLQTEELKIIDFGISTILQQENPVLSSPHVLEGTLAYVSPEQTGRMNRSLDYRSDFYSLGVTLYELFTQHRPFQATDPLEFVHFHLAREPISPQELNPKIPPILAKIILKLMAKNAEERYQTAIGIRADLAECLHRLQTRNIIVSFPLAQQDISTQLQIPQKLYGREQEITTLLAAFERVSTPTLEPSNSIPSNQAELMLVCGYSGIGKSALVREIYKPITQKRGYFITGKFYQYQYNIPYSAFVSAFSSLIKQLLSEPDEQLQKWQQKLKVLGKNGQVIIDVIPELELIIGKQPQVPELSPAESQNRFNLVFEQFIRVFAQPEHPLVLFLDDLQWADAASLRLMYLLMSVSQNLTVLLIGAYRENEVNYIHPLMIKVDEINKKGVRVNIILLRNLQLNHVSELVSQTLNYNANQSQPLAQLILEKTGGNPFFVKAFINTLQAKNLLKFNLHQRCWQWNLEEIRVTEITNNVVELLIQKIQQLPPETQQIIKLAACIGNSFELKKLSVLCKKSAYQTVTVLQEAILAKLIIPLNNSHKLVALGVDETVTVEYKFIHDQIQQAAYSLLEQPEKQHIHYQIGKILKTQISQLQDRQLFDLVNHFNLGRELIENPTEREELAQLNLLASQKAQASAAYENALEYVQFGLIFLTEEGWHEQPDLTLKLYSLAAELAYLTGNFEEMEKRAAEVLQQTLTPLDQIPIYEIKIQAYAAQGQFTKALEVVRQALSKLNFNFPQKPTPIEIETAASELTSKLINLSIEDLVNLPSMSDSRALAIMRILSSSVAPAYITAPELLSLIVFKQVDLSIEYGNAVTSSFGYAMYGLILCGFSLNIEEGYQFGQLAEKLLENINHQQFTAKTLVVVNTNIKPWKVHLRESIKPLLQDAYQAGLDYGDLEFAGYATVNGIYYSYYSGQELNELKKTIISYIQVFKKLQQTRNLSTLEMYLQVVQNLTEASSHPAHLTGVVYNQTERLPILQQTNDHHALFHFYLHQLILGYLFQEIEPLSEYATVARRYLDSVAGMAVVAVFYFYDSLVHLIRYPSAQASEKIEILQSVAANQEKLKVWAHHAPMNYQHKFLLVEAERYRVLKQKTKAIDYYDRAITLAEEQGYIQEAAIAYERAADYYLSKGKRVIAKAYLQEARYVYLRWGAMAKVEQLQESYSQLLQSHSEIPDQTQTVNSTSRNSGTLDRITFMKASEAIASELVLERLLSTLLNIAVENAGAQTGCLILHYNGQFQIAATATTEHQAIIIEQPILLEESIEVCQAIIHFVARTQESLVENNASHQGQFIYDSYIQQKQPKSILCTPLIHQSQLVGLLYLENNLISDAFHPERVELLNLLSTQMAISIENSRLLKQQEELNHSLQQERQQITRILERITDGFIGVDRQWRIIYINQQAEQLLGKKYQHIKGKTLWEACPETISSLHEQQYREATETDKLIGFEAFYSCNNHWLEITVYPDQEGLSIFFKDITERKQMEEKLVYDAQHDALTGLPNRLLLSEHLKQIIQRTQQDYNYRYAVLFLDIDRFKVINDSLGHLVGDQLLIAIARRLKECITQQDIIARLGGDEFIIVLDNPVDEARTAARIQMTLNAPFNLNGYKVFNTVSIGIVSSATGYRRPEELLQAADIAMYQAKVEGRARYVIFDTTMQERATSLLQLETDLRLAIEADKLCVYYQPIVTLKTGKLAGFEALVRWIHPTQGMISPTKFIPLAEETGLIIPIGQWVLQQACYQLKVWQEQFQKVEKLTMSVNLSVKQFSQLDLIYRIDQTLSDFSLQGNDLKLEITESALMNSLERTRELLIQLRSRQIQLCIDDFGTGYSSLSYLHQFPVDILKIDRSFVSRLEGSDKDDEIVRTIIALSHNMSIAAIAEGIETPEQLAQLRSLNCEYGQGYFFARPLDAIAATDLIAEMRQW
jgi:diguanylate cyclase (GGDEF)-like protein/PAS domain S-box-containing protein